MNINDSFRTFIFGFIWILGFALAKGFWSSFFALIVPPWGWYVIVRAILIHYGVL